MRSRIKWYNKNKGYGFIEYLNNQDVFVHCSNILNKGKILKNGEFVDFKIKETDKGLQALDVSILLKI